MLVVSSVKLLDLLVDGNTVKSEVKKSPKLFSVTAFKEDR